MYVVGRKWRRNRDLWSLSVCGRSLAPRFLVDSPDKNRRGEKRGERRLKRKPVGLMDNLYRSTGPLVLYCSFCFALYISLCSRVWWRIQCPRRMWFNLSRVNGELRLCVLFIAYICMCIFICWRVPDSRGHVMHYLFRFLSSHFSSERTNPSFPDVWSRTQNSLFYFILFYFVSRSLFCVLFHCRRIATYFKSIG